MAVTLVVVAWKLKMIMVIVFFDFHHCYSEESAITWAKFKLAKEKIDGWNESDLVLGKWECPE